MNPTKARNEAKRESYDGIHAWQSQLRFDMENEPYPRLVYVIKEPGKEDRSFASPYLDISNPAKLAWALREMADVIEQPWIDPAS